MKEAASQRRTGGTPVVFGVSGHRDLVESDLPALRAQLRTIFDRFRAVYPDSVFELLTPLADGADRVAAEVALESGIKLRVPLPMSQPEYERDFTTPESLNEFRRLLAASDSQWEVKDEALPSGGDVRARKYAAVGDFIARESHVLVLFWDGHHNRKLGGTAWVKQRREYWEKLSSANRPKLQGPGYLGTFQIVRQLPKQFLEYQ
jgi:hypothetical protein